MTYKIDANFANVAVYYTRDFAECAADDSLWNYLSRCHEVDHIDAVKKPHDGRRSWYGCMIARFVPGRWITMPQIETVIEDILKVVRK